jgi:hypothetical protein
MVISLYFRNTLLIRFKIVHSIFSNENTMVVLTLWITRSITEVLLLTTLRHHRHRCLAAQIPVMQVQRQRLCHTGELGCTTQSGTTL